MREKLKGVWLEIKSYWRWFWQYWLPMGLSWPFKWGWVSIVLTILAVLIFLLALPFQLQFAELIQAVLQDAWVNLLAENSWTLFVDAAEGLPAVPVLVGIVLLGLVNLLWAWPRRKFFTTARGNGLIPIRSGGRHIAFLERLRKGGMVRMGLGPAARVLPIYLKRPEDTAMRQFMKGILGGDTYLRSLLIAAPAIAGKTRTAMELVFDTDADIVLAWPTGNRAQEHAWVDLPKLGSDIVLFADDVLLSPNEDKGALHESISGLMGRCENMVLVATHRSDEMPEEVADAQVFRLSPIAQGEMQGLYEEIAPILGGSLAALKRTYTGHPGSVLAALEPMQDRWNGLDEGCRRILQVEKMLWGMGMRRIAFERIRAAVSDGWQKDGDDTSFDACVRALERKGFILIAKKQILVYPGYRDRVIETPLEVNMVRRRVLQGFRLREDAATFTEMALNLTEEFSPEYQDDPRGRLTQSIGMYIEALRFRTEDRAPLEYAKTQNNLGNAYANLARHEEPVKNLMHAVAAYEEVLRFRTEEQAPLEYAMTQNNLGVAYANLARHEEPVENLKRAVSTFEEALRFRTEERAPLDYARTQNNLGNAYGGLARHEEPAENLKHAIAAYEEALRFRTEERAPLEYATTQNNLGTAYRDLAQHKEPVENLMHAAWAFKEALRFQTEERAPLDYSRTQNNLGNAYANLAQHKEPAENLKNAVVAYKETLRFLTEERVPLDYARTQHNLGAAYGELAQHEEPVKNLMHAVAAYEEVLRFRTEEQAPLDYARTHNNLGNAYRDLAQHEEPVENSRRAVRAYEEALRFRTKERAPLDYARTQNNLGNAHAYLARYEESVENLRLALGAYQEALQFLTEELAPLQYATAQNNLGIVYWELARYEEPRENLKRAVGAYEEALRFRTEERAPLDYAKTQNNLGNAFCDLARHERPVENLRCAMGVLREALRVFRKNLPEDHPFIEGVKRNLDRLDIGN